ncbi:MAG TPA: hypothetical protein VG435_05590 [Acidimicrobiales bacterium]|nr:hypothetical protein [Acidimicrobiales bacterium]
MRPSIADFEIIEPWGRSGSRFVCRAPARLGIGGTVLVSELAVNADGWQQLCDHLARLAAAPDAAVLSPIEVGPDLSTGGVFVVTEMALDTLADPGGRRRAARQMEAVEQAARGAHALHQIGVTHGGIRPETVVFTEHGPVLDLPFLDLVDGQLITIGAWSDLLTYDPDLLGGEVPSRSSDVWALGATLHGALSDRPLYPGIEEDEPVTAVQRILFTRPETDPVLPAGIRELIGACLEPDPTDRPHTALEIADRLAELRASS